MKKLMLLTALLAMLALAAVPAIAQISQESEQEGESGELDQSFEVSSSGDNSNQCVGIQGVGNTGNAQTLTDVLQYGSEADEFEFEEVGSTIDVSPSNSTSCDQQVNQAATASG
jgi:ribosome-interacting GTPase 1